MKLKDKTKYLTNKGEIITVYKLQDVPADTQPIFIGTNGIRYSENGKTIVLFVANRHIVNQIKDSPEKQVEENEMINFSLTLSEAAAIITSRAKDLPKPATAEEMTEAFRRALQKINLIKIETAYPVGTVLKNKITEKLSLVVDHTRISATGYALVVYEKHTGILKTIHEVNNYEVITRPEK